jgi:hypothetical protein
MLSPDEQAFIADNLTSGDHDYFVWSGLVGEPFLCDGILCYFDGETVAVVGHTLGGTHQPIAERLPDVIATWCRCPDVAFINYFGPLPAEMPPPAGWVPIYSADPRPWNREVFLDLAVQGRRAYSWEIRGQLRMAARHGVEVTNEQRQSLGHEHISLLRSLATRQSLAPSDAGYCANVVSILRGDSTMVWEARVNGKLTGFAVTHEHFLHRPFLVVGAFDRAQQGTSDSVYAAVLEGYLDRGGHELGLGYAVDEGLFRYKTKWPGARIGPPCHQFIWQRLGVEVDFNDCLHWPWRLMTGATRLAEIGRTSEAFAGVAERV